jgi:mono/diheme cytochrome c family protein
MTRALVLLALFALACGPGAEVRSGRELYLAYGCAACHGEHADGRGPSSGLSFVKPRDLRDHQSFRGARTAEGIATIIAFGVADGRTGMPGYPDIPKRERLAMAEYILSLQPPRTRITVHESHPMQSIAAAYIDDLARPLVRVTTPAARVVELHEMKTMDGVMSMNQVERIGTPPAAGSHLMLIDLVRPLRAGDTITLTLTFDDGTTETIDAPVRGGD